MSRRTLVQAVDSGRAAPLAGPRVVCALGGIALALMLAGVAQAQPVTPPPGEAPAPAATAASSAPSPAPRQVAPHPAASHASSASGLGLSLSPGWTSLTPGQKQSLAPLEQDWDSLDSALKGKWLEIAAIYPKLTPEHQKRLRERMVAWTRLSPAERQRARIGYQRAGELRSEEQQSRLTAKWEAYQALPAEKRQRLAERAAEKAAERAAEKHKAASATAAPMAAPLQRGPLTLTSSGPTVIQALPGATTVLLTQRAEAPLPGATAASGVIRPLRSPREAHLDPHTLRPRRDTDSQ